MTNYLKFSSANNLDSWIQHGKLVDFFNFYSLLRVDFGLSDH